MSLLRTYAECFGFHLAMLLRECYSNPSWKVRYAGVSIDSNFEISCAAGDQALPSSPRVPGQSDSSKSDFELYKDSVPDFLSKMCK